MTRVPVAGVVMIPPQAKRYICPANGADNPYPTGKAWLHIVYVEKMDVGVVVGVTEDAMISESATWLLKY